MHRLRPKEGVVVNYKAPVWEPLVELAPEHVGDFMWMHEVELEDGTRLHAYKHYETRQYLHLDHGGRAFVLLWAENSEYEEVAPNWLLRVVLEGRGATIVGQKLVAEFKRLRWARAATRHRISRKRARQVIEYGKLVIEEPPPAGAPAGATTRFVFLGPDEKGRPLEVMAICRRDGCLQVIHAMELRQRYRQDYEEACKWRR